MILVHLLPLHLNILADWTCGELSATLALVVHT